MSQVPTKDEREASTVGGDISVGRELRRAREVRGISLPQLAEETRISRRHLLALEDDRLEDLPGRLYARNFVKTYARALGIEEQELLDCFDYQCRASQGASSSAGEAAAGQARQRGLAFGALALALVVIGAVLAFSVVRSRRAPTMTAETASPTDGGPVARTAALLPVSGTSTGAPAPAGGQAAGTEAGAGSLALASGPRAVAGAGNVAPSGQEGRDAVPPAGAEPARIRGPVEPSAGSAASPVSAPPREPGRATAAPQLAGTRNGSGGAAPVEPGAEALPASGSLAPAFTPAALAAGQVPEPVPEPVAAQVAEPVAAQVAEPATEPVAEPVSLRAAAPVTEAVPEIRLSFTGPSWVEIWREGASQPIMGLKTPGQEIRFPLDGPIQLKLANAGHVVLRLDGELARPLGAVGEARTLRLDARNWRSFLQ